jgi:hypothetical protein
MGSRLVYLSEHCLCSQCATESSIIAGTDSRLVYLSKPAFPCIAYTGYFTGKPLNMVYTHGGVAEFTGPCKFVDVRDGCVGMHLHTYAHTPYIRFMLCYVCYVCENILKHVSTHTGVLLSYLH